jgi:hypothetical protein
MLNLLNSTRKKDKNNNQQGIDAFRLQFMAKKMITKLP